MSSKNLLNLDLKPFSGFQKSENGSDDIKLEQAISQEPDYEQHETYMGQRKRKKKKSSYDLLRIPQLLMLGYASEESKRRYELQRDWHRLYVVLNFKIENIVVVSGLLLASSCTLLVAGDLRRLTFVSTIASIFGSILSIIFGLLCQINISPARLKFLVHRSRIFYFLYSTPSLWGGAAALVFFVAVCAYTWIEESTAQYGWPPRAAAIIMSVGLIFNAGICFVLGASVSMDSEDDEDEAGEKVQGDVGDAVDVLNKEEDRANDEPAQSYGFDDFDERNRRARRALPGGFFGIHDWGSHDMSSDSFLTMFSGSGATARRPNARHSRSMTVDERQNSGIEMTAQVAPPVRATVRSQTQW